MRRVLVVDDDESIAHLIEAVLTAQGFSVSLAGDADTARRALVAHEHGVAILDKNLPGGVSGIDLLSEVAQACEHTRALMYTGFASKDSAIEALRRGAYDYIEKPIDNDLLLQKVERAWNSYSLLVDRHELFRKYAALFEIVPGIVWFMTEDGIIRRINREGAAMLGYTPEDILGRAYDLVLRPDEANPAAHWAFKERRTGDRATRRQTVQLKTRDGRVRLFQISSTGAYDREESDPDRRFWGTLGVGWDITDETRLAEQLHNARKMEAIGRLASGVAHDFSNLLVVILGAVEDLEATGREQSLDPGSVATIRNAAQRGTETVRTLLALGRQPRCAPGAVDCHSLCKNLEPLLRKLLNTSIELRLSVDPNTPEVEADPSQIEHVLINLAANARDAMRLGGVLTISVGPAVSALRSTEGDKAGEPATYVMFAVHDTGAGMTPEIKQHLFEPFFTTKEPGAGSGMGLATTYAIVTQVGGKIDVDSEVGGGTTVRVFWPAARSAEASK